MLDSRQLASLQGFAVKALDQTCTITRVTSTPSNIGTTESVAQVYSGACLLGKPTAQMLAAIGAGTQGVGLVGNTVPWIVTVPSGTNVKRGDRVTVSGFTDTFEVQTVQTPQSYSILDSFLMAEVR